MTTKLLYFPERNVRAYATESLIKRLRELVEQRQIKGTQPSGERWRETKRLVEELRSRKQAFSLCALALQYGEEGRAPRRPVVDALLANWQYPYDYLVIGEGYTTDDNVRLYMPPGFPQFCVDSFNVADLVCCQPAPSLTLNISK